MGNKRDNEGKCARTDHIVAIKTVAYKLVQACYYILRDQVSFDLKRAFT